MSLNYIHPINSSALLIDEDKKYVSDITSYLNAHIYGDIYISLDSRKRRTATYSFLLQEIINGTAQTLEIPLVNRKRHNVNVKISYVISDMIPEIKFNDLENMLTIFEGTTSENYVKVDVSSVISKCNIETDFMITFLVQSNAEISQQIGAYILEENLENVSIKINSNSGATTYSLRGNSNEETLELTDAEKFVDKYYDSWIEDIINAPLVCRSYEKHEVELNQQLNLTDNKSKNIYTSMSIHVEKDIEEIPVVYNEYGSIIDDTTKQPATGYFHTTLVGDRAWVVDPEGYLNIVKNVAFPLPRLNTPHPNQISAGIINDYDNEEWTTATENNMKALAFNTYEQYYDLINNNNFAYNMNVISKFPLLHSWAVHQNLQGEEAFALRNIFDPHFKFKLKWKIEKVIFENDVHKDPHVLAYILDNEPRFSKDDLLACILTTDTELSYRKSAALRWLNNRFNLTSVGISDITDDMCDEFLSFEFYVYSKVITDIIRGVDNNHMIFSPALQWYKFSEARGFLKDNDNFFKVLNKFYDAVVLTHYSTYDILNDGIDKLKLNIPVFLNEFSMKSLSDKNFINKMAGPVVNTQDERGQYYEHIATQCIKNKNCIGYTWYQYSDIVTSEGLINRGIVDQNNNIYEDLGKHMCKINTNAEALRK